MNEYTMAPRKNKAKGRKGGRRRGGKAKTNVPDKASCSVKQDIAPVGSAHFGNNTMYSLTNIQLSQFPRALSISKGYQHYRIKSIKLTIRSSFDTYDATLGTSKPDLYYQIDKAGVLSVGAATLDQLKQMGSRPRALDEKPVVITWTPSVLSEMEAGPGAVASSYKLSPWLSTDADTILHRGIFWFANQIFGAGLSYTGELECQFEFKKPVWTAVTTGQPPAVEVRMKTDGINNYPASDSVVHPLASS